MDTAMVELLCGSTGAQSAAGDCTALVVHGLYRRRGPALNAPNREIGVTVS
jgi:hypothetical protein